MSAAVQQEHQFLSREQKHTFCFAKNFIQVLESDQVFEKV
jgi:hypothetical protein